MWGSCFLIPVCLLSHVSTDLSLRFYAAWWREEKILLVPFNKDWHGFELALVQIRDNLYGTEEKAVVIKVIPIAHCVDTGEIKLVQIERRSSARESLFDKLFSSRGVVESLFRSFGALITSGTGNFGVWSVVSQVKRAKRCWWKRT